MNRPKNTPPHTHSALTSRRLFYLVALFFLAAVFVGGCDGIYTLRDYLYDRAFVPIADITGIPSGAVMGPPLTLNPVIVPDNATKKTVSWSVSDPGDTGAAITGSVFRATAKGTAKITARVADGLWRGKDFVKAFTVAVIGEYAVTYHLNGGTLPEGAPAAYRTDQLPLTLPTPVLAGRAFLGWYDNAEFLGDAATAIPLGSTGSREYWAKWEGDIDVAMTEQASGVYWSYDSGTKVITIEDGADVTLTGSTTQNRVAVESGAAATVTLQDVTINISGTANAAFDLGDGATVTLLLSGTNALTSGGAAAGVHVTAGRTLVIDSAESANAGSASSSHAESGTLTVSGGSTGGAGAGIGGGMAEPGGEITISGGTITAYASYGGGNFAGGAGIGGGGELDNVGHFNGANHAGTILISGGIVTAIGGDYTAGIGGGAYANSAPGSVTITGGTVTATGGGWGRAAGIGGSTRSNGGNITITGGTVTAAGSSFAAGIGGGYYGAGGTVMIAGGTVTATGGGSAAGIGSGRLGGSGGTITITDGTVTAAGGDYAAGIGGGYDVAGGTTSISGGIVTATGGVGAAGIGGGYWHDGGTITISGGTVFAQAGTNVSGEPAAIGGGGGMSGGRGMAGDITISGGVVVAVEGIRSATSANIGTNRNIVIRGGTVITSGIGKESDTVSFTGSPANAVVLTGAVLDSGTYTGEFPAAGALLVGSEVSISFTGTIGNTAAAGTVTLNTLFFIPEGATLRVPPGWTLVTNGCLVNNGTVIQSAGAAITGGVSGSVTVE